VIDRQDRLSSNTAFLGTASMGKGDSVDLRAKEVAAYAAGRGSISDVAELFGIGNVPLLSIDVARRLEAVA
jgi:hypothetical protein